MVASTKSATPHFETRASSGDTLSLDGTGDAGHQSFATQKTQAAPRLHDLVQHTSLPQVPHTRPLATCPKAGP